MAAETAADLTLDYLLHPARATVFAIITALQSWVEAQRPAARIFRP